MLQGAYSISSASGALFLPNMYTFAECYSAFVASDPHLAFNSQSTGAFMLDGTDAHTECFIYLMAQGMKL